MSRKSEYDAAYFTLLRAREELDHMRRYAEFLGEELERLAAFSTSTSDSPNIVPRKFRRLLDSTATPLLESIGKRRAVVLAEIAAMPERVVAQEEFVQELEDEVVALRP